MSGFDGMALKLLYLVTEDWYFCSHRLALACAARDSGYDVLVVTQVGEHADSIKAEGFKLIPIRFPRSGRRPWRDLWLLWKLVGIYRTERPQLVHHVSIKPVLYGSLAVVLSGISTPVVNALTGLGYLFTSTHWQARFLRRLAVPALRLLMRRTAARMIVQNPDDRETLFAAGIVPARRTSLVPGSGVELARFSPEPEAPGPPVVVLAARMLWDKGVGEFVEAARSLRGGRPDTRFVLVGDTDPENPSAVPLPTLQHWHDEGVVEWWGWRHDMTRVFRDCHVVCLPSYREGLPKVLLEAAAAARPTVATDVPGCREITRHGENGLLVPAQNAGALAVAIEKLLANSALRRSMGERGRRIVEAEFSIDRVIECTLEIYRSAGKRGGAS